MVSSNGEAHLKNVKLNIKFSCKGTTEHCTSNPQDISPTQDHGTSPINQTYMVLHYRFPMLFYFNHPTTIMQTEIQ